MKSTKLLELLFLVRKGEILNFVKKQLKLIFYVSFYLYLYWILRTCTSQRVFPNRPPKLQKSLSEFLCLESTCERGMETEPRLRHKVWRRLALKIPHEFIHSLEVVSNQHSTQCFFRNPWPGISICWSLKENICCFDGL